MDTAGTSLDQAGRILRRGLLLVPLFFLALFFFYPLAAIVSISLAPEGQPDLTRLGELAAFSNTLWFTIGQALLSTFLTLALAIPTAYVFVRYRFPGKSLLLSLLSMNERGQP